MGVSQRQYHILNWGSGVEFERHKLLNHNLFVLLHILFKWNHLFIVAVDVWYYVEPCNCYVFSVLWFSSILSLFVLNLLQIQFIVLLIYQVNVSHLPKLSKQCYDRLSECGFNLKKQVEWKSKTNKSFFFWPYICQAYWSI